MVFPESNNRKDVSGRETVTSVLEKIRRGCRTARRRQGCSGIRRSRRQSGGRAEKPIRVRPSSRDEFDGEARRGGNGREDGDSGGEGFLGDFEAAPATDQQDVAGEREMALKKRPADDFVDRVVAADVFADFEKTALGVEERGGMETASAAEDGLLGAENVGEAAEDFRIDAEVADRAGAVRAGGWRRWRPCRRCRNWMSRGSCARGPGD